MLDGKIDVFIRPAGVGSSVIDQLGLKQEFCILDAGEAVSSDGWKKYLRVPGRSTGIIPANSYKAQINNVKDVRTGTVTFQFAVNREISEQRAYRMTKLTWDHLAEIKQTAVNLKTINQSKPFFGRQHAAAQRRGEVLSRKRHKYSGAFAAAGSQVTSNLAAFNNRSLPKLWSGRFSYL